MFIDFSMDLKASVITMLACIIYYASITIINSLSFQIQTLLLTAVKCTIQPKKLKKLQGWPVFDMWQ